MRQAPNNPVGNCLPSGANEEALLKAIGASGYPLQGLVAHKLAPLFTTIAEEWGYIDRDTQEQRCLDVLASKRYPGEAASVVTPTVVLLVECKRSVHPFVLFKNVTGNTIPQFPTVAGLKHECIMLNSVSGTRGRTLSGAGALGLRELPFIENGPSVCACLSRAILEGKKVKELSGAAPFSSIVLPLVKTLDHVCRLLKADGPTMFLSPTLVLSIGILDAPIVLVESPDRASDPVLTPWARVVRHEAIPDSEFRLANQTYCIDMVHIDYLDEFLSKHLMPFADEFGRRAHQMGEVLVNGGEVQDIDNWTWDQIRKWTRRT